jgi:hypothetical protein
MNRIPFFTRLAIFVLVFFLWSPGLQAQKDTYDIKPAGKKFQSKCGKFIHTLAALPKDVRFSVRVLDGQIFIFLNNEAWFDQLFQHKTDGFAIDVITKKQFSCSSRKLQPKSWAYYGELLPPFYFKDHPERVLTDGKTVGIYYGDLPEKFDPEEVELNLLILVKKHLCHYSKFYDLESHGWSLLETGMYLDTLPEDEHSTKYSHLYKDLRFTIHFPKNKAVYDKEEIRPLYDSLRLTDYYITHMSIRAFTSVEGTVESNEKLQQKRVKSIVNAIEEYQDKDVEVEIVANENWVEFLNDISNTRFDYLTKLSKDEIKEKLKNPDLVNALEPYLSKHRKAIIGLKLEKKTAALLADPIVIKELYDQKIAEKNIREAQEIQQVVFEKIGKQELPESFIGQLEVPESIAFGSLLFNHYAYAYTLNDANLFMALENFERLEKLLPGNPKVKYNLCVLRLKVWQQNQLLIHVESLKKDILSLEGYMDKSLVKRLMINFHIIKSEYDMYNQNYKEKDQSLKFIFDTYKGMELSNHDALNIAKYFANFSRMDWAEALLQKYVTNIHVEEDLIFYYLNLTMIDSKYTRQTKYRTIMLNSVNQNRDRFCRLFSTYGQGGISFQILDDGYLKKTYCENCN